MILKQYSELIVEWWPIRKKRQLALQRLLDRIFDKLRTFPSQDRKKLLKKAITGGWKDIYPLKKGSKFAKDAKK